MRAWVFLASLSAIAGCGKTSSSSPSFTLCRGTYALCTTAKCNPVRGKAAGASTPLECVGCKVREGFSVGEEPCSQVPGTPPRPALIIPSRYYPISAMAVCFNSRPWAGCLDAPCTVDRDRSTATCLCKQAPASKQPYVIVTDSYRGTTCTTDTWSSATVDDALQLTGFLQGSRELPPLPITIVGVDTRQR
jgi:hypothetical protein